MEDKRTAAIRKQAEAEALRMIELAEQKAFQIVEESKEKAQTKTESDDKKGVERVADAPQTQRLQQTLKPIMEKVA
jgi:vacuolar-type H+-ATPase subunit E/Vma4